MADSLYQEQILDHYHHPRHQGEIKDARKLEGANRSCGDELVITLETDGEMITAAKFTSRACAICTASTDMLLDQIIGQPISTIQKMDVPAIQNMIGIPLSPIRLKCALLPLETLKAGLAQPTPVE